MMAKVAATKAAALDINSGAKNDFSGPPEDPNDPYTAGGSSVSPPTSTTTETLALVTVTALLFLYTKWV